MVTLTLTATAASLPPASHHVFPAGWTGVLATILAAGLLAARRRTRRGALLPGRAALALWLVVLGGMAVALNGCNGGFPLANNATPPGPYTIVVTGTSGTAQHSGNVMLSVE